MTPAYVHHLLDAYLGGTPLDFHGDPVPADVQHRLDDAATADRTTAAIPLRAGGVHAARVHAVLDVMGWPDDRQPPATPDPEGDVPSGVHWALAEDIIRAADSGQPGLIGLDPAAQIRRDAVVLHSAITAGLVTDQLGDQPSGRSHEQTTAMLAAYGAALLRDMADRIDRGITFPLAPSVISMLLRERADDVERDGQAVGSPLVQHDHTTGFPVFAPDTALIVATSSGHEPWTGAEWNTYVAAALKAGHLVTERLFAVQVGRSAECTTTCPARMREVVSGVIAVDARFARTADGRARYARAAGHPAGGDWVRLNTGSGRQYEGYRSALCPGDGTPGHTHDVRCVDRAEAGRG